MLYPPLMLYNLGSDPKPQEQTRLGGYNMLKHTQRGLGQPLGHPQEPAGAAARAPGVLALV